MTTNDFLAAAAQTSLPAAAAVSKAALPAPATVLLDDLMARVGVDGLAAAFADPGLLALLDQHAAAIRDALLEAGIAADAEGLSAYARSIVAAATRHGRRLPAPGEADMASIAWMAADWHLLRLVAICMLAEEAGAL